MMPWATAEGAAVRAEALRARVAAAETIVDGARIRVTLSIGVATQSRSMNGVWCGMQRPAATDIGSSGCARVRVHDRALGTDS